MMRQARVYGGTFDPDSRNDPRAIISRWVPHSARVLEVGPGDGVISRWLKQSKNCHTVGVEVVPEAAQIARPAFDHIVVGSIEDDQVIRSIASHGPFDDIVFADVLEHLVDPWNVLGQVRSLLTSRGHVLISVPNIAHWSARLNLLVGRFDYSDGYLMDRTHLRWFTRQSTMQMARQAGYSIVEQVTVYKPHFARLLQAVMGYQFVLKLAACE
jgi:2-polyprenyl-3-methyl-5-hydroxy-6-metoxy-1,4-benzoquinol methylase